MLVVDSDGTISKGSTSQPVDGLFCEIGRKFLQIFQRNGIMVFFDGKTEFDVSDPAIRAIYVTFLGGEILLLRRGICVIRVIKNWEGPKVLAVLNDPTYDRIDFEADRFLLTCAKLINNKSRQAEVINNWRSAQQ